MYEILSDETILRVADGALIPADERNTDYRAFLSWVDENGSAQLPASGEES